MAVYEEITAPYKNVTIVTGDTYGVLRRADAALVKSGTSTLETALIGIPQVVCYTGNRLSYAIAKRLVKIGYISLVNLIADAPVVAELIQDNFNTVTLEKALQAVLIPEHAQKMKADYRSIRASLGEEGASLRAANAILY